PFVWLGADTPWGGGSSLSFPSSRGEGPCPGQAQGQGAGSRASVPEWLVGSGRPETAWTWRVSPPRGTRGGSGVSVAPGARTPRGLWLSRPVGYGEGRSCAVYVRWG